MVPARGRFRGRSAKVGRGNLPGARGEPEKLGAATGKAGEKATAPAGRDAGRGGGGAAADQARVAMAWLKVADGRMTAAAFAGSGW